MSAKRKASARGKAKAVVDRKAKAVVERRSGAASPKERPTRVLEPEAPDMKAPEMKTREAPRLQLGGDTASVASNRCPKCDAVRWSAAATCHECGLVFAKWKSVEERRQAEAATRELEKASARVAPIRIEVQRDRVGLRTSSGVLHLASFTVGAVATLMAINGVLGSPSLVDVGWLFPSTTPGIGAAAVAAEVSPDSSPADEAGELVAGDPAGADLELVTLELVDAPDGATRAKVSFRNRGERTLRDVRVQGVARDRRGSTVFTEPVSVDRLVGRGKPLDAVLDVSAGLELTALRVGLWRQDLEVVRIPMAAPSSPAESEGTVATAAAEES